MKIQTLSLLAAGSTCIIAGSHASAQISGISVASKPNELGLLVCNVYAERGVMEVNLLAIGGTPLVSSYSVIDGTFCDFDGDGVGINDFLELLSNWGPCP
jgi:hypothetical protein